MPRATLALTDHFADLPDPRLDRTKLHLLGKDLLAFSRETVQMFKRDGERAGFQL